MRTTLDIADDVLSAVKERAQRERKSAGEVLSELARRGLNTPQDPAPAAEQGVVFGLQPFPKRGGVVTNEKIHSLREDDAY